MFLFLIVFIKLINGRARRLNISISLFKLGAYDAKLHRKIYLALTSERESFKVICFTTYIKENKNLLSFLREKRQEDLWRNEEITSFLELEYANNHLNITLPHCRVYLNEFYKILILDKRTNTLSYFCFECICYDINENVLHLERYAYNIDVVLNNY